MKSPSQLLVSFLLLLMIVLTGPSGAAAQSLQATDFAYEGFRNVRTNGNDSTYGQALTHRYVNGELRLLTIAHPGILHEFRIAGTALGGSVTTTTATWDLRTTGGLNNFNGIWYEQAKNRLWLTSAQDYTTTNHPAKITLIALGASGVATTIKTVYLNVPAKRVYGGCNAVPSALVSQLGGPYVCGWGGYTSLVMAGGGASIGPTMYAIADPDSIANGGTLQARTILDAAGHRGVRRTLPVNYFDGGDPRQNPPTRPTDAPLGTASWLSPNSDGHGWMVWGDSYYNTGVWIGTTYAAVASLCGVAGQTTTVVGSTTVTGSGACWYQSSTLAFDGRQFELHLWDGAALGSDPLARPASTTELDLPRGNTRVWSGNTPVGNIAGATYDAVTGRLYLLGFPFGTDYYTGRLFSFTVNSTGSAPAEPTGPTVGVIDPINGATLSGDSMLEADAADEGGVSGVWFTVDGATVGAETTTAPYRIAWDTRNFANGTHSIKAVARNNEGAFTSSLTVSVTVDNPVADTTPPAVSLMAPTAGTTVSGIVGVSASASDNVGVASVQFALNGVNLGSADTRDPYAINWNTTGAANGTHVLSATARDAAGNVTASSNVTVTVNNAGADTTAPTVSLTSPTDGATLGGKVTISASASDNVGVASVQFTLDGASLGTADSTAPYEVIWDTTKVANGPYVLGAVARDATGNVAAASSVAVEVGNQVATGPGKSTTKGNRSMR